MAKIDKSMIIMEVITAKPCIAPFLLSLGMHCLGCPEAWSETLEEAARVHDLDADRFVRDIESCIAANERAK